MKKTKTGILFCKTLCLLIYFLFFSTFTISAQHQEFSESFLQLSNPVEKYRLAIGYADKEILYDSEAKLHNFFNLLTRLASIQKDPELLEIINYKAKHHWLTHNLSPFDKIEVSEKFLETNLKQGNLLLAGHDYHFLAQQHFILQQYENAFESYLSAFQCFEKIGFQNVGHIDMFLHDFALANYYFKNYQEVIRLMYLSLQFPASNKRHDIQRMNNLGLSFLNLGCNDSAIFYLNKTSELAKVYNDFDWLGISSGNIGNLYYNNQQYQEALSHYKDQQDYLVHTSYEPPKISSYINLAKAYIQLDSFIEAHEYLNKAEYALNNLIKKRRYGEEQQLKSLTRKFYEEKYQLLAKEENFKEAIKYRDSVSIIQSFIESKYNTAVVKISEDKVIIQNSKLKISQKEKEKTRLKYIYTFIISSLVIIGLYIYWGLTKAKKRKEHEAKSLLSKNKAISLEREKAEKELLESVKALDYFKNKIAEQNLLIETFEANLKQNSPTLPKSELEHQNNILNDLNKIKILTDEDWISFQSSFKAVYPLLFKSINNFTPIFTLAEKRFLMLAKLGFSNKEMASVVGVSEGAIRITWKRIREKNNLSTNCHISEFISLLEQKIR